MKLFKIIIILAAAVGVSFILLEAGLNLAHYNFAVDALYQYNPDFGWTQLSNINYYYANNLFSINKDGFRDINHAKEKPAGVTRIAFVGSHYLRGTNSAFDKMATTVLAGEWNSRQPDKKIEVFNFCDPKYNIEMAYFLIKKMSREYDIDYFFYVFDPEKDPVVIAGGYKLVNYAPALIFGQAGEIREKNDFVKAPYVTEKYKSLKIFQFLKSLYYQLIPAKTAENSNQLNIETDHLSPYPGVYLEKITPEISAVIEKTAKIMDYAVENAGAKVYFLMLPPQELQFYDYYEKNGNLEYFADNHKFIDFIKDVKNLSYEDFINNVSAYLERNKGNHFNFNNLNERLKPLMEHADRLIGLNEQFLEFINSKESAGFLYNWHRRDAGQVFLAEVLANDILPKILVGSGH